MSDNMESDERGQKNQIGEEKMSDIVEDLTVEKMRTHKYVDNVETEYDLKNLVVLVMRSNLLKETRSIKMMIKR